MNKKHNYYLLVRGKQLERHRNPLKCHSTFRPLFRNRVSIQKQYKHALRVPLQPVDFGMEMVLLRLGTFEKLRHHKL